MKKILSSVMLVGLCAAVAGLIASCAVQKGPLSPNTSLIGVGNSAVKRLPKVSSFPAPNQYTPLYINFDSAMDPSSFSDSTVQLFTESGSAPSVETAFTSYDLRYDASIQRLIVTDSNGSWPANTSFRLLLTTGIRSASGQPLDGNGNGVSEGAVFDNYTVAFAIGAPSQTYNTGPLALTSLTVGTAGNNLLAGNLANQEFYLSVTATFNDFIDVSSAQSNINAMLTNAATGAPIAYTGVSMPANTGPMPATWFAVYYQLTPATRYKLNIKGGLAGYRSVINTVGTSGPLYGRYFDGNSNGVAEASDDLIRYITTFGPTANPIVPPTAAIVSNWPTRSFTITFTTSVATVPPHMTASTLNSSNIQLQGAYTINSVLTHYNIQPKDILYDGVDTVEVFLPDSFYPNNTGLTVPVTCTVTRHVTDANGLLFDGNGDGIGGQKDDDQSVTGGNNFQSQQ